MKSEVMLDFCFIRERVGGFKNDIENEFEKLFCHTLHWYLDEKITSEFEMIVAEVRGMQSWQTEQDVVDFIVENASQPFWGWLQGYQLQIYPNKKGCGSCGCS